MQLTVSINANLDNDLVEQAKLCEITPARYIEELVECAIAERRIEARHTVQPHEVQPGRTSIYDFGA